MPKARPVSTFGFGAKKAIPGKGKRNFNLDDETATRKKLERLPSPVPDDVDMNGVEPELEQDDDDDIVMQNTEEESAAALRAAAAQRAERQQNGVEEVIRVEEPVVKPMEVAKDDDEEPDPLDAFMMGIGDAMVIETAADRKDKDKDASLFEDEDIELVSTEADPNDILAMAAKLKKKKELPTINHAKMHYDSFRKSFYVEPAELSDLTEEEVDELRLELDGIKIRVSPSYSYSIYISISISISILI